MRVQQQPNFFDFALLWSCYVAKCGLFLLRGIWFPARDISVVIIQLSFCYYYGAAMSGSWSECCRFVFFFSQVTHPLCCERVYKPPITYIIRFFSAWKISLRDYNKTAALISQTCGILIRAFAWLRGHIQCIVYLFVSLFAMSIFPNRHLRDCLAPRYLFKLRQLPVWVQVEIGSLSLCRSPSSDLPLILTFLHDYVSVTWYANQSWACDCPREIWVSSNNELSF